MKIATKISLSFLVTGVVLATVGTTAFYMIAKDALHKEISSFVVNEFNAQIR